MKIVWVFVVAMVLPAMAAAQTPANQSPPEPLRVGRIDVGVTAEPPPGTAVLSGETLRLLDRRDLAQAAALVPGISLRRLGPRNDAVLFLRGFDLRQVPLYVDGFPVYVPYDGLIDLSRFLTADVSEIRVSKGVTSVLYGPNTLAVP